MVTSDDREKHCAQIRNEPYNTVTRFRITKLLFVITSQRDLYTHVYLFLLMKYHNLKSLKKFEQNFNKWCCYSFKWKVNIINNFTALN